MLDFFLKRSKGSITVMVTLIMIPMVFFTGFLTDLARIKLYSNQAVMTADNYGEAVIAEYDYLLKELYGLFAITQDEDGLKAIESLQSYMKTSFDPTSSTIVNEHLAGYWKGKDTDYTGFMPYKSAKLELDYELVEDSKLSNKEIMSSQIGDFMRFRILQELIDDESQDGILEALEEVQNTDSNADVIDKKAVFDDQAGTVLEIMGEYYETMKDLLTYRSHLNHVSGKYSTYPNNNVQYKFNEIYESDSYKHYKAYMELTDAEKTTIKNARNKKEDERSDDEKRLIAIEDDYNNDANAKPDELKKKFNKIIDDYTDVVYQKNTSSPGVNFENFTDYTAELLKKAKDVKRELDTLIGMREAVEQAISDGGSNVSEDLKDGIEDELKLVDELTDGDYSGAKYIELAEYMQEQNQVNAAFLTLIEDKQIPRLNEIRDQYMKPSNEIQAYEVNIEIKDYHDFTSTPDYNNYSTLYRKLQQAFDNGTAEEEAEKAKQTKKAAKEEKDKAEKELNEKEETTARNIPDSIAIGDNGTGGGSSVSDLIKTAASYFAINSISEKVDELVLKFYTVAYDFGMFSSRTTNVHPTDASNEEKEVSLTGVQMGKNVNYLYQAELEYLFGGHKSSQDNLDAAKNRILAFRAVVNMTATYKITPINSLIEDVRNSLAGINPVLGLAAAAALRAGITAMETAKDWENLKKGNFVVLIKSELSDLTSDISVLLPGVKGQSGSSKNKLKLDYNQYLMVMITFLTDLDKVAERTADLISLNVSAVQQKIGENGELSELSFDMDKAYTAVDATCAVHLDFVVMPQGFAKKTVNNSTYNQIEQFEKNYYKFTVTRGY